ncbi:MAG: hypothetical protein CMK59_14585 [Proteobacteria bacterium]|nr:hypothetical protein [Pseudomonadota bacterium]
MRPLYRNLLAIPFLFFGWSNTALAISCDDIMNLVGYNVDVQTISDMMNGKRFSAEDIKCLEERGAPAPIVEKARSLSAAEAPQPVQQNEKDFGDFEDFGSESQKSRRDDEISDEIEGDMPKEIREAKTLLQSKRSATAAYKLFKLIEDNTYPDRLPEIQYYLARSLTELQMFHSAQHYYTKVVEHGPSNQYFNSSLARLVSIARLTGDDFDLKRVILKNRISPDLFPRKAKSHLHYLLGILYYDDKNPKYAMALKNFEKVSPNSVLYLKSRYIEGVIYTQQEKLKSAVRAFRDVYSERERIEPTDAREKQLIEDLTDLALLNIASIYFSLKQDKSYEESSKWFDKVNRSSQYWPEALFRDAWAQYHLGRYDEALGRLLTLDSPYFSEEQFIPEAEILKAITYYSVCDYSRVDKIVNGFDATYKPMKSEIQAFLEKYNSPEGKKLSADAWLTYFGPNVDTETTLSKSYLNRILRNQELSGIARHLSMMRQEIDRINAQDPRWKDVVGNPLLNVIAEDELRYQKIAGRMLVNEMSAQKDNITYLITQAGLIKLDLSEAKIKEYKKKANIDAVNFEDKFNVSFATSSSFIYWPFNGEFWADELGYYKIKHGSCK